MKSGAAPHLVRDDVRQRGLSQSRRTSEQNVIERLATLTRGSNIDAQIFLGFGLPDVLGELRRTQRQFVLAILFGRSSAQRFFCSSCFGHWRSEL